MSLGHRGIHSEVEIITKIQFDLLFKITICQEVISINSDFEGGNKSQFYEITNNWGIYAEFVH